MLRFWKQLIDNQNSEGYGNSPILEYLPEIGSISDTGRIRSNNQDNIGIINFSDSKNLLAIVADGMGGHQGGEVASRIAVETIQKEFSKRLDQHNGFLALKKVFQKANNVIFQLARQSPELAGMGTTLVAMVLLNGRVYYANTGDSRLYWIRAGQWRQLSQDHTLVNEMVHRGLLEPEAAKTHPDKHVISRAVGTHAKIQVDVPELPLSIEIGDSFLLCSDGLYDLVEESEMVELIGENTSQQACQQLVDLANSRGGYDNISIIIIKILKTARAANDAPVTRY
ncbi:MAG: Stp1/IreP family PP2C-type Ser/Thr phosphatase [Methylosarcina sp.]